MLKTSSQKKIDLRDNLLQKILKECLCFKSIHVTLKTHGRPALHTEVAFLIVGHSSVY